MQRTILIGAAVCLITVEKGLNLMEKTAKHLGGMKLKIGAMSTM